MDILIDNLFTVALTAAITATALALAGFRQFQAGVSMSVVIAGAAASAGLAFLVGWQ